MLAAQWLGGCSPLRISFLLFIIFFFVILPFFTTVYRQYGYATTALKPLTIHRTYCTQTVGSDDGDVSLDDPAQLLYHLWRPLIHNMTEKTYRASNGKQFHLPDGPPIWTKPLGKKVLILDVDTRFDGEKGTLANPEPLHREGIEQRSAGRVSHMTYAMVHGYDYRFVRAPNWPGRFGTWTKIPVLKEAARSYDTVVLMDADAYFVHMDLPLEWLMNYWKVTKDTSITLPRDPDIKTLRDSKGLMLYNTGFVIAQKSARTQEILAALEDCPDEERFAGCAEWKKGWAHEQRAFGEYVRYAYNKTTDVLPLRMQDANTPHGIFVRHDWPKMRDPLEDLQRGVMDMLVARMHMHFHEGLDHYYRDLARLHYPLTDVEI